jgi:hypothetical protein
MMPLKINSVVFDGREHFVALHRKVKKSESDTVASDGRENMQ